MTNGANGYIIICLHICNCQAEVLHIGVIIITKDEKIYRNVCDIDFLIEKRI